MMDNNEENQAGLASPSNVSSRRSSAKNQSGPIIKSVSSISQKSSSNRSSISEATIEREKPSQNPSNNQTSSNIPNPIKIPSSHNNHYKEPYREPVQACPAPIDAPREASQILPFLWQGSLENAVDDNFIQTNNITHVINISTFEQKSKLINDQNYLQIHVLDDFHTQIDEYLLRTNSFLKNSLEVFEDTNGMFGTTLVHCHSGISRATTVTCAFIMAHRGMGFEKALSYVRKRRHHINPNLSFCGQLTMFEKKLREEGVIPSQRIHFSNESSTNSNSTSSQSHKVSAYSNQHTVGNRGFETINIRFSQHVIQGQNNNNNNTDRILSAGAIDSQLNRPPGQHNQTKSSTIETDNSLKINYRSTNNKKTRPKFLKLARVFCVRDSNSSISNDQSYQDSLSLLSSTNNHRKVSSGLNGYLCCGLTTKGSKLSQESPSSEKSSSSQTPTRHDRVLDFSQPPLTSVPVPVPMNVQQQQPIIGQGSALKPEEIGSNSLSRNSKLTDSTSDLGFCGLKNNNNGLTCGVAKGARKAMSSMRNKLSLNLVRHQDTANAAKFPPRGRDDGGQTVNDPTIRDISGRNSGSVESVGTPMVAVKSNMQYSRNGFVQMSPVSQSHIKVLRVNSNTT